MRAAAVVGGKGLETGHDQPCVMGRISLHRVDVCAQCQQQSELQGAIHAVSQRSQHPRLPLPPSAWLSVVAKEGKPCRSLAFYILSQLRKWGTGRAAVWVHSGAQLVPAARRRGWQGHTF